MTAATERLRRLERWIAWVRLGAVPFAIFQVSVSSYTHGYATWAAVTTGCFAAGAVVLFGLSRLDLDAARQEWLSVAALVFDVAILSGYTVVFSYESGTPTRQLLYLAVVEAAVRFGIVGAVGTAVATAPVLALFEQLRHQYLPPFEYRWDYVSFQLGVEVILGL